MHVLYSLIYLFIYLLIYIHYLLYIYIILYYIYMQIVYYIYTYITRCIQTNSIHYTHTTTLCSLCARLSCGFPNESKYLTLDNYRKKAQTGAVSNPGSPKQIAG